MMIVELTKEAEDLTRKLREESKSIVELGNLSEEELFDYGANFVYDSEIFRKKIVPAFETLKPKMQSPESSLLELIQINFQRCLLGKVDTAYKPKTDKGTSKYNQKMEEWHQIQNMLARKMPIIVERVSEAVAERLIKLQKRNTISVGDIESQSRNAYNAVALEFDFGFKLDTTRLYKGAY